MPIQNILVIFWSDFRFSRPGSKEMNVVWSIATCRLVEIALLMEAVNMFETSVSFCHRRDVPQNSDRHVMKNVRGGDEK